MKDRVLGLVAAASLAIGGMFGAHTETAAASELHACSGTLISRTTMYPNGSSTAIAELLIYWQSSTGRNCAVVNHVGASYGVSAPTSVSIERCAETRDVGRCSNATARSGDSGSFKYFAGPVSVYSPTNCVVARGSIVWRGQTVSYGAIDGC